MHAFASSFNSAFFCLYHRVTTAARQLLQHLLLSFVCSLLSPLLELKRTMELTDWEASDKVVFRLYCLLPALTSFGQQSPWCTRPRTTARASSSSRLHCGRRRRHHRRCHRREKTATASQGTSRWSRRLRGRLKKMKSWQNLAKLMPDFVDTFQKNLNNCVFTSTNIYNSASLSQMFSELFSSFVSHLHPSFFSRSRSPSLK
jgi:hypothetical protein